MKNVNPTFMLNHAFFIPPELYDIKAPHADRRRWIFHRWGGLGNHRYQIGFSGDVIPAWDSLEFQVYFTSTASNVGYGFWSHDLGGHTQAVEGELYTRWMQWGCWSPIMRSHCTKAPDNDRRIWKYDDYYYEPLRAAMELRRQLIPFMYTLARDTVDTGVSPHMPLYYNYPEHEQAYTHKTEFLLGDDVLVVPVTAPMDNMTKLSTLNYWLPPGIWIEIDSGEIHVGPASLTRYVALDETLVLVKQGSIMPMIPGFNHGQDSLGSAGYVDGSSFDQIQWDVYVGHATSGCGKLYDDDGITPNYIQKKSAWTHACYTYDKNLNFTLSINADMTNFPIPARNHIVHIPHFLPPSTVRDSAGQTVMRVYDSNDYLKKCRPSNKACWWYEAATLSVYVASPATTSPRVTFYLTLSTPHKADFTAGFAYLTRRLWNVKDTLDLTWFGVTGYVSS